MTDSILSGTRRRFMQYGTLLGVSASAMLRSGDVKASLFEGKEAAGLNDPWPQMQYRKLGRTGHESSRLVFGCGATLSGERHDDLLNAAFDAGVNTFDVGFKHYYSDAERNLAPFLKTRRDQIFLISKAYVPADIEWDEEITLEQARQAAAGWRGYLEESLRELQTDHVDAYYYMASNNVSVITNEEIHRAFEDARDAGKVKHLGLSTHQNAANVLRAAIDTGWFDLAMIAITPGGWYDWQDKAILPDSPPMQQIRPLLDEARQQRYWAGGHEGRTFPGWPALARLGQPGCFR